MCTFDDSYSRMISTVAIYQAFNKYCERSIARYEFSHYELFRDCLNDTIYNITPVIDSANLHRVSFRAGDFSQVRNSADSWKQERERE